VEAHLNTVEVSRVASERKPAVPYDGSKAFGFGNSAADCKMHARRVTSIALISCQSCQYSTDRQQIADLLCQTLSSTLLHEHA